MMRDIIDDVISGRCRLEVRARGRQADLMPVSGCATSPRRALAKVVMLGNGIRHATPISARPFLISDFVYAQVFLILCSRRLDDIARSADGGVYEDG